MMTRHTQLGLGLVSQLVLMALGMFAFGYALIPLYDVFCSLTGLGGRTNENAAVVVETPDQNRVITIEFVTTVNQYAPWEFSPTVTKLEVHPGKLYDTIFLARNLTESNIVGQAVPSVSPSSAARHFKKTECFCFTAQVFGPTESKEMPVQFLVDNELPEYIDTITLSYTFFKSEATASTTTAAVDSTRQN